MLKKRIERPISRDTTSSIFMNRLLLPVKALPRDLHDALKKRRVHARATKNGVRITSRDGAHFDFLLPDNAPALAEGGWVYVWATARGYVCVPIEEAQASEARGVSVAEQVRMAREVIAKARDEREQRVKVDVLL